MKVKELIEELQKCNQNADVFTINKKTVGDSDKVVDVDKGNPASSVSEVVIIYE